MSRAMHGRRPPVRSEIDRGPEMTELVTQLVAALRGQRSLLRDDGEFTKDGEAQPTLLDMHVDGLRVVVTRASNSGESDPEAEQDMLSPREQEIARMVMKGYGNKTIAAVLDISVWTVGTHLRRVFAKLRVGTRAEMVARLLEDARHGQRS